MRGKVNSLNASNAAAILAYEVLKQRTLKIIYLYLFEQNLILS